MCNMLAFPGRSFLGVPRCCRHSIHVLQRAVKEWNNHCLYNLPRDKLLPLLKIPSVDGHVNYDFPPSPEYRFVLLGGYDISAIGWPPGHRKTLHSLKFLSQRNPNSDKNCPSRLVGLDRRPRMFNGGVGEEQLTNSKQKVVICCHMPLHPCASSLEALLWNYNEVMDVIHRYDDCV